MRASLLAAVATAVALSSTTVAWAAPPANDGPGAPGEFAAVTAENGTPDERQAVAELAEATADAAVPACLGEGSFARTVWYRVAASDSSRELTVEAAGRTTDALDLAAFVGPSGGGAQTAVPNACGSAADSGADQTAAVTLRVPAGRAVLVQVGRRGAPGSPDDERAILSLRERGLEAVASPAGDSAGPATPDAAAGSGPVALGGATLTEEDPAQPACPSFGSVWRRHVPARGGPVAIAADGGQVATLTVFRGERPARDGAVACVNRERSSGPLELTVDAQAGAPLWIRVGTDRPPADAVATLRIGPGPASDAGPAGRSGTAGEGCVAGGGLRSVGARPRGRRLTLPFARRVDRPVTVDVFQQSIGRRVIGERLVARFAARAQGIAWSGRANRPGRRVADGYLFARFTMRLESGALDVRRITLRRVRGRFTTRPAFQRTDGCGLLTGFKLTRPVFGGPANRDLGVAFRLASRARVTVEVLRGGRVVRRFPATTRAARTLHRLTFSARGRPAGDYRVRLTARAGTRTVRASLTARRL